MNEDYELKTIMKLEDLTQRQRDVALLAAQGLSNEEIAQQLGIGKTTVSNHMAAVAQRLGITGRRGNRVRVRVTRWVMDAQTVRQGPTL